MDYAKVLPSIWTGPTGRQLCRLGGDAQRIALFLVTGPNANFIGLYHLPIPMIQHYLGLPLEGASEGLRRVEEAGFAFYDHENEEVWVPEMAAYQIGEQLKREDNRVKGIIKEAQAFRKSKFFTDFCNKYGNAFHLPKELFPASSGKPLGSPLEAPSEPLRSQQQQQQQQQQLQLQLQQQQGPSADGGVALLETAKAKEDEPAAASQEQPKSKPSFVALSRKEEREQLVATEKKLLHIGFSPTGARKFRNSSQQLIETAIEFVKQVESSGTEIKNLAGFIRKILEDPQSYGITFIDLDWKLPSRPSVIQGPTRDERIAERLRHYKEVEEKRQQATDEATQTKELLRKGTQGKSS